MSAGDIANSFSRDRAPLALASVRSRREIGPSTSRGEHVGRPFLLCPQPHSLGNPFAQRDPGLSARPF
jgi:hypothetical protein